MIKSALTFVLDYRGSEVCHGACRLVFVPTLKDKLCPEVEDLGQDPLKLYQQQMETVFIVSQPASYILAILNRKQDCGRIKIAWRYCVWERRARYPIDVSIDSSRNTDCSLHALTEDNIRWCQWFISTKLSSISMTLKNVWKPIYV